MAYSVGRRAAPEAEEAEVSIMKVDQLRRLLDEIGARGDFDVHVMVNGADSVPVNSVFMESRMDGFSPEHPTATCNRYVITLVVGNLP